MALDPPMPMWPILKSDLASIVGDDWWRWFQRLYSQQSGQLATQGNVATLKNQTGSVTTQTLSAPVAQGEAHIHWYVECTVAGGAGTTVQVQVGWKHNGQSLTRVFPPAPMDTLGANASDSIPIVVDANSPITYSLTYAGAGGGQYTFSMWVTQ